MFGDNLKRFRTNMDMTQKELAEKLCVVPSMVTRLERGTRQPSVQILRELRSIFGVTADDLIDEPA